MPLTPLAWNGRVVSAAPSLQGGDHHIQGIGIKNSELNGDGLGRN